MRTILFAALALLTGCMTRDSFAEQSTTLLCEKIQTCMGAAGMTLAGYDSVDECISEGTNETRDNVDENSCEVFDSEQAQACLDAIEAASCSGFVGASFEACDTVCGDSEG